MVILNARKGYRLNKKRLLIFIGFIILIIVLMLYLIFKSRNYEIEYSVDNYQITEIFDKKEKYYSFKISFDDKELVFSLENKSVGKKLIKEIEIIEADEEFCLNVTSVLDIPYLCMKENEQVSLNILSDGFKDSLVEETDNSLLTTYESISLYALGDKTYYVWDYNQFYKINKDSQEVITLFDKDVYELSLSYQVDNYILVADYTNDYTFSNMYVIDMKTSKVTNWDLEEEFYLDSYFLGAYDGSIFMVDRKRKVEVEFYPKKTKYRYIAKNESNGKIYNDGWEKVTMNKLINSTLSFTITELVNYYIEDNILYMKYIDYDNVIKITNSSVDKIIYSDNTDVYYLVGTSIYHYSIGATEELVMDYFEWNFSSPTIYIY